MKSYSLPSVNAFTANHLLHEATGNVWIWYEHRQPRAEIQGIGWALAPQSFQNLIHFHILIVRSLFSFQIDLLQMTK